MLSSWSDFFALTGSPGATLVGLLFVVVTLGTNLSTSRTQEIADASMTPALYCFGSVLLQSMVALAPWPSDWSVGVLFLLGGIVGSIYRIVGIRLRQRAKLRVIASSKNWVFYNLIPIVAAVCLICGGAGLIAGAAFAPFAIAGSSALFLICGIYQSWTETLALIALRGGS
jgi:hypothetical protein